MRGCFDAVPVPKPAVPYPKLRAHSWTFVFSFSWHGLEFVEGLVRL